ncbi:MAG: FKBP-type peptidyl-prolyl cis-trans isomerase [Bacteroidota bacterium]|nr:FKBP-type peptidyl-prolyl cis-trans isomerase [Bacteroidota bacterium]MDP4212639.1 FKBP-type peptidyl-prolyl cis-trans isomerase [Bacteroidota bacterium]MDP4251585.1 FKBP-type peptidyl-prolyl cis-trans isomerase [Bacteroidota bacterium]
MKKINSLLFALVAITLLAACNNQGLKKTKSGLLYKIITDKKNPVVKKGQFIKLSFVQKLVTQKKDSVLVSSETNMPAYVPIDTATQANYSPVEIFHLLRKGDSAIVVMIADSIENKTHHPLPPYIKKKDKIMLMLKVVDVFDNEELVQKDRQQAMEAFHVKETQDVEAYLAKNHIQAQKTAKGTYVKIDNPGDGPAVDSGKQVSVIYTGKMLPSGKEFESNDGPGKEPIKFVIGKMQIIPGWDDGLRLFKKGGSGTLYIPAFLAYDAAPGPGRTPNEDLMFDVKIVDVTDAPAEKPMNMMPHGIPPAAKPAPKAKTPAK